MGLEGTGILCISNITILGSQDKTITRKSKRHLTMTMNCKDPNLWSKYYVHRRQIPIDNAMCIEKGKALNNLKCNCFNISITAR